MLPDRPRLNIPLSKVDKLVEAIAVAFLIALWLMVGLYYRYLPDQIPSHFNAAGKPDDYSYKSSIFLLPCVAIAIYVLTTWISRFPHLFNFPKKITAENAQRAYLSAIRLLRWLKVIVLLIFGGIVQMTIDTAKGNKSGLSVWFLPLAIALLLAPVLFFIFKQLPAKR